MTKPEILDEKPITSAQVKEELAAIQKRDGELNFRANKTMEHLQQVTILSKTKAKELQKKLEGLDIPRLKDVHVIKIVDLLPRSLDDLKVVLQGYTLTVKSDNQKRIIETVKEYL